MEGRVEPIYMITESQIKQMAEMAAQMTVDKLRKKEVGTTCNKAEAAELIGVTRATIYSMIIDGRLKTTADGKRILTSSVDAYISDREQIDKQARESRRIYKRSYV